MVAKGPRRALGKWPPGAKLVIDLRGTEAISKGSMSAFAIPGTKRAVITDSKARELKPYAAQIADIASREMDRLGLPCADHQSFELLLVFYEARPAKHYAKDGSLLASAPEDPINKPDFDKLTRGFVDALTGVVFDDDCRVPRAVIEKRYSTPQRDIGVWAQCRVRPGTRKEAALARMEQSTLRATE